MLSALARFDRDSLEAACDDVVVEGATTTTAELDTIFETAFEAAVFLGGIFPIEIEIRIVG